MMMRIEFLNVTFHFVGLDECDGSRSALLFAMEGAEDTPRLTLIAALCLLAKRMRERGFTFLYLAEHLLSEPAVEEAFYEMGGKSQAPGEFRVPLGSGTVS